MSVRIPSLWALQTRQAPQKTAGAAPIGRLLRPDEKFSTFPQRRVGASEPHDMKHNSPSTLLLVFIQISTPGCFGSPQDSTSDSAGDSPTGSLTNTHSVPTEFASPSAPEETCTEYPNSVELRPEATLLFATDNTAGRRIWSHLYYHDGFLFWRDELFPSSEGPSLMKAPSDGSSGPERVHQWEELPVFAGKLHFHGDYIFHRDSEGLQRLNWKTGVEELVYDEPGTCSTAFNNQETAEDAVYIYYTLRGTGNAFCREESGILRIHKDTLEVERIESTYQRPSFPVVRGNVLYFANQLETDNYYDNEIVRFELDSRVSRVLGTVQLVDTHALVPFENGVAFYVPEDINFGRPRSELWYLTDDGIKTRLFGEFCAGGDPQFLSADDQLVLFDGSGFSLLSPGDRTYTRYYVNASDDALQVPSFTLGDGAVYYITMGGEILRSPL